MSVVKRLQSLKLPEDAMVTLTYEEGTDAVKSNYAVFGSDTPPLTESSITISFGLAPGASGGGGIGGFQIVSLPDPPTIMKPEVKVGLLRPLFLVTESYLEL